VPVPKISQQDLRTVYDKMEREMPELWQISYPRIYTEPPGNQYYSPKEPARQILGVAMKFGMGYHGRSDVYEFLAASHLVRFNVPIYWIAPDMATAIQKTVPPQEISWYTMPMPFDAGVFMLPKGSMVHPTEGDVGFVAWARLRSGEEYRSKFGGKPYGSINGGMEFLALTMEGQHLFHWNLPLDACGPNIRLPDIEEQVLKYSKPSDEHETAFLSRFGQPKMSLEDNLMLARVAHFTLSTLLLMDARPKLITPARLLKKVETKGRHKEFWSPNILGEHYKIQREGRVAEGSHASPDFHWVRGFWREQAHGPQFSLRRRQWIEPFTRGLEA
jgi:hypothetical protein